LIRVDFHRDFGLGLGYDFLRAGGLVFMAANRACSGVSGARLTLFDGVLRFRFLLIGFSFS
jgi:hypothetical protein